VVRTRLAEALWKEDEDRVAGITPLGRIGRDLATVPFWHALGLWKIAIICEGVRRRALDDDRNVTRTGIPAARVVEGLITQAQHVLFEARL
jgi:hypothetical protein